MNIDKIVSENDALEQLNIEYDESNEAKWVDEFDKLSKRARDGNLHTQYDINYLIGLTILIPTLQKFRSMNAPIDMDLHTAMLQCLNSYITVADRFIKDAIEKGIFIN